ncbi:unnamed protein product [Prorocentrum cordatum]|uniref:Uncharacterized protein n=1 Tax=Prorocentrum cordatum TaxID=2364126 RepID=A0ABN9WJE2_9DINO|nr:unnamed protein product [Polarella glacialis]
MRRQLYISETTASIKEHDGHMEWDRDPDGTIFTADVAANVQFGEGQGAARAMEAGFDESTRPLQGPTPGRRPKVSGDASAAQRNVHKARRHLRLPDGCRRSFSADTMVGGTSRNSAGLDKAARMVRREIQTSRMASIIK